MRKITEFLQRNICGVIGIILLINSMAIIYMIRYATVTLIELALAVGIIDVIFALILFIIVGVKYTQTLIREIRYGDSENKK